MKYDGGLTVHIGERGVPVNLRHLDISAEICATDVFVKPDGAADGSPALIFLCRTATGKIFVHQLTLTMLMPAIEKALEMDKKA